MTGVCRRKTRASTPRWPSARPSLAPSRVKTPRRPPIKHRLAEAPRFGRKQQCEQEFGAGNCESRQEAGGGSFFMPMMMGYMMGNMMGGNRFSQPVYRGPGNTAVMPSGGRLLECRTFRQRGRGRPFGVPTRGADGARQPRRLRHHGVELPRQLRRLRPVHRLPVTPRTDWRAHVERDLGFAFHTIDGAPYWDETACYRFHGSGDRRDRSGHGGTGTDGARLGGPCGSHRRGGLGAVAHSAHRLGGHRSELACAAKKISMVVSISPMAAMVRRNCWNTMPIRRPPCSRPPSCNGTGCRPHGPNATSSTRSTNA